MANTKTGKAFEYACLLSIKQYYSKLLDSIQIIENDQFKTAKSYFDALPQDQQSNYLKAGLAGTKIIHFLEPKLEYCDPNSTLELSLQADSKGQKGDVRDVLCIRHDQQFWSIGISCKHNSFALKHPRLSPTIDFGKDWLGFPCSTAYFDSVSKIFDPLKSFISSKTKWDDSPVDKINDVYKPLLTAFMDEFKRIYEVHKAAVPQALVQYLIGENDFYKVIDLESKRATVVLPVNLHKSLNIPYNDHKSLLTVDKPKLPSVIYHIGFKKEYSSKTKQIITSDNTIIITCDEGWTFSLRIHNASSKIEKSLKFDVQAVSTPDNMRYYVEPWD